MQVFFFGEKQESIFGKNVKLLDFIFLIILDA